jgi:hypothetical protein
MGPGSTATEQLDSLHPELIGGLFGRPSSRLSRLGTSETRFLTIACVWSIVLLALAVIQHVLTLPKGSSAFGILITSPERIGQVQLPLSQDPVAIAFILVTFFTPIFCAKQVRAIKSVVQMNEDNFNSRPKALQVQDPPIRELNARIAAINRAFDIVGNPYCSFLLLLLSGFISYIIYVRLLAKGLLKSWNATRVDSAAWATKVYTGWWANYGHHQLLAIVLWALGGYLFYFLLKQLTLGALFANYAGYATNKLKFGIVPNMDFNSDGYWGLLPLRRFMQWTYISTVAHFITTLGVFIVWLPFSQLTVTLAAAVMLANTVVVFHPSSLAYRSIIDAKSSYVKDIAACDTLASEEKEKYYTRIWEMPNLPFRTRSALTAVTAYFLLPLLLAVVSSFITRH